VSHPTLEDVHVEHHIVGPKTYGLILLILLCLTALTTGIAFVNLGVFSPIAAIGIAVLKATLVILFFMHLRYDRLFHSVVFVSGILAASLFVGFTLMDTGQYQQTNIWQLNQPPVAPIGPRPTSG
jgi:cytochrome c oxidase subunit IV